MSTTNRIDSEKTQLLRKIARSNPLAPQYHFLCPEGIRGPFDPNGAIFWKGRYHLFYIFQSPRTTIGHGIVHCWGHASSRDLLHWDYHPTALRPEEAEPQSHIFSGGAFLNKEGKPTIVYHGVNQGTCIAVPEDDDLIHWRNLPQNPVIPEPFKAGDPGWGIYNVFDPHAWVEGEDYYAILGGKVKPHELHDTAYLFRSRDLLRWEYLRPFYHPNPHWTGEEEDCACPDFFKLGNRWMLACISHPRGARYYLGRYENGTFVPEEHHRMNWPGGSCFAPESLRDDQGRRIFWAWVLDQRKGEGCPPEEFGVLTMPRVLSLDDRGRLQIDPPEEFKSLRGQSRRCEPFVLRDGEESVLHGLAGDTLEVAMEAEVPDGGSLELKVRMSPDEAEQTVIRVDRKKAILSVDTTRSSRGPYVYQRYPIALIRGTAEFRDIRLQEAPFELALGEPVRLRIFIDRSILEVYANRRQCVTQRIYPTRSDSLGTAVSCRGGVATMRFVEAWELASTNAG